jgi:hypothetical protein
MTYQDKIRLSFRLACQKNGGPQKGASASDVTMVMRDKGWISPLDSVIDIADLMKEMGNTLWHVPKEGPDDSEPEGKRS